MQVHPQRPTPRATLILVALTFMLGIVAADSAGPQPAMVLPLALAAVGAVLLGIALRRSARVLVTLVGLACALAGAARLCAVQPVTTPESVWLLADGNEYQLAGWIATDPRRTETGQQFQVQAEAAELDGTRHQVSGRVLVTLPSYPEWRYGQRLVLLGMLSEARAPRRPGEFDYRAYLRRRGILVTMRLPAARALPGDSGQPALRMLLDFRDQCKAILLRELPEPQASIAIGVLLGLQSSIPDDVYDTFSITGTSHILVVSGWNFTIVAAVLAGITRRLGFGKRATLLLSLLVLWWYAMFVGATGTVLRAAVMASLMVIASAFERRSEPWHLLFAACWLLAIADPYVLWDLGFELSALATASLFAFGTPVQNQLERIPVLRWSAISWATEALTATLAAQILALPILLFQFGNLSLIAPLANIVLVPVVPYTMLLGTLALLAGLIWLPFGQLTALAVWLPLTWLTEGARLLAQTPWAAIQIPAFPLWQLLAYYAAAVGFYLWRIVPETGHPTPDP